MFNKNLFLNTEKLNSAKKMISSGPEFFEKLEIVKSKEEMQELLRGISFAREALPYDLIYDQACFVGFMFKLFNVMYKTPKWQWFLESLDEDLHLKPLKEEWDNYFKVCRIWDILKGLREKIINYFEIDKQY